MPSRILPQAMAAVRKPSVALVLPYNPKMTPRAELEARLKGALAAAEKKLFKAHPAETAMPVVRNLQQLVRGLNSSTHKVGVALFVSEEVSKVIYLDYEVEERVLVDEPFLVRDLADCKAGSRDFLVLLLSAKESRMYWSNGSRLKLIKTNGSQNVYVEDREVMLNKFLHFMDQGLGAVLKVYPLPVFVVAIERVAGHFARVTHYPHHIAGVVQKEGIGVSEAELMALLAPQLADWEAMRTRLLLQQMEKAAQAGKLVCGVHEVRKAAGCRNSRLIIVERQAPGGDHPDFYADGEIDGLIEKVLENGGSVEKLDKELLLPYGPVAVIKYY
ncbi:MAG TPA: hypothetical protein VHE34_02865 [Puia sp.]|uniref:baeRF3 domain-containing protein n=1 Tax=Puia sp. TaxID=2045100 RepID=UPI002C9F46FF|nr:hypothetical protein [Puia sp.]HVU94131.1 hypothetical protein [Puia sp.]